MTIFAMLLFASLSQSQMETRFITAGKIEFERKQNTHRLFFTGETNSWDEMFKKSIPVFRTDYFDLYFTEERSLYKPGKGSDAPKTGAFWLTPPGMENIVYRDLEKGSEISQKQIFEQLFLINDSVNALEWKIQNETRTIAGFECRKALTRICDSVVVVAFYTEEIIPTGGPESFQGLPGMILGLAVPRLYTTWFATKVEILSEKDQKLISPPTKGKKSSEEDVLGSIDEAMKNWWDKSRDRNMWLATL